MTGEVTEIELDEIVNFDSSLNEPAIFPSVRLAREACLLESTLFGSSRSEEASVLSCGVV